MKSKASVLVNHIISVLSLFTKMKLIGVKCNVATMRARFGALTWLRNRKLSLAPISLRLHALLDRKDDKEVEDGEDLIISKDVNALHDDALGSLSHSDAGFDVHEACIDDGENVGELDDGGGDGYTFDQDYIDSLVADDDMELLANGSIIEMAKRARENEGKDFSFEGEIDHAADLFIKKFHKQLKLQKLESFKRYQKEMLDRREAQEEHNIS